MRARRTNPVRKIRRWLKRPENRAVIYLSILQGITCGAVTQMLIALKSL